MCELDDIYMRRGHTSEAFCIHIRKYVYYLVHRYARYKISSQDEFDDFVSECYRKILSSMTIYDPKRSRVANYIHAAVRNVLGSNRVVRSVCGEDFGVICFDIPCSDNAAMFDMNFHFFQKRLKYMRVRGTLDYFNTDDPVTRLFLDYYYS